jgi:hypothetical protein
MIYGTVLLVPDGPVGGICVLTRAIIYIIQQLHIICNTQKLGKLEACLRGNFQNFLAQAVSYKKLAKNAVSYLGRYFSLFCCEEVADPFRLQAQKHASYNGYIRHSPNCGACRRHKSQRAHLEEAVLRANNTAG